MKTQKAKKLKISKIQKKRMVDLGFILHEGWYNPSIDLIYWKRGDICVTFFHAENPSIETILDRSIRNAVFQGAKTMREAMNTRHCDEITDTLRVNNNEK